VNKRINFLARSKYLKKKIKIASYLPLASNFIGDNLAMSTPVLNV